MKNKGFRRGEGGGQAIGTEREGGKWRKTLKNKGFSVDRARAGEVGNEKHSKTKGFERGIERPADLSQPTGSQPLYIPDNN